MKKLSIERQMRWFCVLTREKPSGTGARRENPGNCAIAKLWKRVIAWERSRAASGYEIIWGYADRNKQEGI